MCQGNRNTHGMPERSKPGDAGAGRYPRRGAGVAGRKKTDASEEG